MALNAGLNKQEVSNLLSNNLPEENNEEFAINYARKWAERRGKYDPQEYKKLINNYGDEMAKDIELTLRLMKTGNYMGNTWDNLLYHISLGHKGRKIQG